MYEPSEDETARRQIRYDYDERQEEINHGIYPIVVHRGKAPAPVKLGWWKRFTLRFRGVLK